MNGCKRLPIANHQDHLLLVKFKLIRKLPLPFAGRGWPKVKS